MTLLYPKIWVLNPAVFPRQEGNDCGPCVNFLATMFARDPGTFHSMLKLNDTAFEFPPSNEMRIDQAKEIFDFLMPEWTLSLPLSIMHVVCSNYLFMYEECVTLQIGYNQSGNCMCWKLM